MRVIDWNISYAGDTTHKINYLESLLTDDACVFLQEVKPHAYEAIEAALAHKCKMVYSLDYRSPSKFDSDARKLGVMILVSNNCEIIDAGVIERSPFPDRTAFATIKNSGNTIKLLSLHSLTGCGYYRTKSVQYDSFAEFVESYRPDIIGVDANEPQIDHYDINQMQFFDNGPGAKQFFEEIRAVGLMDAYVLGNGTDGFEYGKPLAKSHHIRRKGDVRYDFLFVRDTFAVNELSYFYDTAVDAGSDHAIIVGDIIVPN